MSEETVVLPQLSTRFAAPALLPTLVVAAAAFALATGFLYVRSSRTGAELAEAHTQTVTLRDELSKAQQKSAALEAQLAAQQRELEQGAPMALPVDVTFRAGHPSTGFVARFQNFGASDFGLKIRVSRSTGESRTLSINLPVHGMAEVGRDEGWEFASGDMLTVAGGSYQPLTYRVP